MNLRIAFACFGLATATALSAQTTTRHHELGIQLEQSYGFMYGVPMNFKTLYKVGASDKAVWRFQVGNMQFGRNYYEPSQQRSSWISMGGSIGREWRKEMNADLRFFHGPLIGAEMSMSRSISEVPPGTDNNYFYIMPNLIYVLGIQYRINPALYVAAEIHPGINTQFNYNDGNWSPNRYMSGGMNGQLALLSVAYQFETYKKGKTRKARGIVQTPE